MRIRFSSYSSLVSFRAAAVHESFSRAADDLNVTHGAVSRAIRQLEADLGTPLFERRNRRVFLTEDGRAFAEAVSLGLQRIEQAAAEIKHRAGPSQVRLSCEPTLLMRWLIPRMAAFYDQYKDIDLQLIAGGGPVILGQGVDLAIRRNDFDIPDFYQQVDLCNEEIGPVCSTKSVSTFFDAGGLKPNAPLLHTKTRPEAWRDWFRLSGVKGYRRQAGAVYEHFYLSLQACIAGQGVAIGPRLHAEDALNEGFLEAPLGFQKDGTRYVLLMPKDVEQGPSTEAVKQWLLKLFLT